MVPACLPQMGTALRAGRHDRSVRPALARPRPSRWESDVLPPLGLTGVDTAKATGSGAISETRLPANLYRGPERGMNPTLSTIVDSSGRATSGYHLIPTYDAQPTNAAQGPEDHDHFGNSAEPRGEGERG
jgi:hypothetical protein